MNRRLRILSALLVLTLATPVAAQVTDEDIARARDEVNRMTSQSAELGQEVIDAYARQESLGAEIERLSTSIEFARGKIAETEDRLQDVAVELYMGSTTGASLSVLFSAGDQQYPAGMEYLREVNGVDASIVDQLRGFREELDRQTTRLGEALDEQVTVTADLQEKAAELQDDLIAAQKVYDGLVQKQAQEEAERRRREEEERQRREAAAAAAAGRSGSASSSGSTNTTTRPAAPLPPPVPPGTGFCPVAGAVSFSDSWGAPRSGGRTHKGVDMIAARGVPVVAVYSGHIRRTSRSTLGGNSVYFVSDAGDLYYYAHLDSYGDIRAGQSVPAGYVIGYVGSTGNAPDYLPHLHWEYHPGGGSAVDPYPLAKKLCG
jgi:peptidoglycan LD-endopeptidase LytH